MFGPSISKIEKWGEKKKISKLEKVLSHNNVEFRNAAFKALGESGDQEAITLLTNYIRHPDADVRKLAAKALGNSEQERTLEFLRKLSRDDEDEGVKEAANDSIRKVNAAIQQHDSDRKLAEQNE